MLKGCSWQQFLIAASVFTLVWVLVVLVVYYRKDLRALISGGDCKGVKPLVRDWEEELAEEPAADRLAPEDVMGKPALPDGISVVAQDDFSFRAGGNPVTESPAEEIAGDALQADVFDLMEDIKDLLKDRSPDRGALIEEINRKVRFYHRLIKSPLLDSVYELIAGQVNASEVLGFEISAEELKENL